MINSLKRIIFTVTNELNYDQRMIRICTSLTMAGYEVELVGVETKFSSPIEAKPYSQKRLMMFSTKGFTFYAEYNLRLFFYLLFKKCDTICCIDLDTIIPVYLASLIRRKVRVYDAHEYFSQLKEVVTRPAVYKVWYWIERTFLPRFKNGYTVCKSIADEFKEKYAVEYSVIRNVPLLEEYKESITTERVILYQGAVNEGRGLEYLIPAMAYINIPLLIYGDGNFMYQAKQLIEDNLLEKKVILKGKVLPNELRNITSSCLIGLNLVENIGLNQYYSLANKFFDYIHDALPQITMNFPEYKRINDEFEVAVLIDNLSIDNIVAAINDLLADTDKYHRLKVNCINARESLNWQKEEQKLLKFYAVL